MNCVYCHQPVAPPPVDSAGVVLSPALVHLGCVAQHYERLGEVLRKVDIPRGATSIRFSKFASMRPFDPRPLDQR